MTPSTVALDTGPYSVGGMDERQNRFSHAPGSEEKTT